MGWYHINIISSYKYWCLSERRYNKEEKSGKNYRNHSATILEITPILTCGQHWSLLSGSSKVFQRCGFFVTWTDLIKSIIEVRWRVFSSRNVTSVARTSVICLTKCDSYCPQGEWWLPSFNIWWEYQAIHVSHNWCINLIIWLCM